MATAFKNIAVNTGRGAWSRATPRRFNPLGRRPRAGVESLPVAEEPSGDSLLTLPPHMVGMTP